MKNKNTPFLPGSKIGVIGGGQLGRMLIFQCRRMGYYSAVIDPDIEGPAAQVADEAFHPDDVLAFAKTCHIATYEFEHFDIDIVKKIAENIPVFPSPAILDIKRNRVSEKTYLSNSGFPVPRFWIFNDGRQVQSLVGKTPLMVKTATGGYDGKGLYVIRNAADYECVKDSLKEEIIAEELVPFVKEISIICARNRKGDVILYPAVENLHKEGILFHTIVPSRISKKAEKRACDIVSELAHALDLVGLVVVEMFLLENDDILINEFAPRPHNSGHYTLDACDISQFEMYLRAGCDLPLITPQLLSPAAMLNIIGKGTGDLRIERLLSIPGVKLHLYGKKEVRERRKMGHVNIVGKTEEDVKAKLSSVEKLMYQ